LWQFFHKSIYHLALKENTSLNALIGKTLKYTVDNNLSGKIFSHASK
jgi:predicted HicB family RNase H-like nuclease